MAILNTYLNFEGKAEAAFLFYQSIFGGKLFIQKMSDTPYGEQLPDNEKECAMHVSLTTKDGLKLMASDILPSAGHQLKQGNNYYISIDAKSREEADKFFNELAVDGNIEMPMEDMFWGDYFGSLSDKFGIQWMVSYNKHSK